MDTPPPAAAIDGLSFEQALAELERIVRQLEAGDTPLDDAVDLYTRGERLRAHCADRLARAQERIDQIVIGTDGSAAGVRAFDAP